MKKEVDYSIIKTVTFQIPLPELQRWRAAAKHRELGVMRWLRDLAAADIALIERGGRDE
jgi:hypothetical protein